MWITLYIGKQVMRLNGSVFPTVCQFLWCLSLCACSYPSHLPITGQEAVKATEVAHNLLQGFPDDQCWQGLYSSHHCRATQAKDISPSPHTTTRWQHKVHLFTMAGEAGDASFRYMSLTWQLPSYSNRFWLLQGIYVDEACCVLMYVIHVDYLSKRLLSIEYNVIGRHSSEMCHLNSFDDALDWFTNTVVAKSCIHAPESQKLEVTGGTWTQHHMFKGELTASQFNIIHWVDFRCI